MNTHFAFGTDGLELDLPDDLAIDIIPARPDPALADPKAALMKAFEKPLMTKPFRDLLQNRPDGKICIVISDATRP